MTCYILSALIVCCSNQSVRQHVSTSRGLFPHKRVTRRSEMTARGLVVTEEVESLPGHAPMPSVASVEEPLSPGSKRSPIAELLYMRWLEGLKLKWPSFQ